MLTQFSLNWSDIDSQNSKIDHLKFVFHKYVVPPVISTHKLSHDK